MIDSRYIAKAVQIKDALENRLLAFPGVQGLGLGWKEVRGEVTTIAALRVYVSEKLPVARLRNSTIIPREIGGIVTDVLPVKTGFPITGHSCHELTGQFAELNVGAAISNLKAVLTGNCANNNGSGLGTLGLFAIMNGASHKNDIVLVSNRHVLYANGALSGDLVYQPRYTYQAGRYHFDAHSLNPVAELLDMGLEGNYNYAYPGESAKPYFVDCATARLNKAFTNNTFTNNTFTNNTSTNKASTNNASTTICRFPSPGVRKSRKPIFKQVARVHAIDAFTGRELRVRKLGRGRDDIIGKVVDVMATVVLSGGQKRYNNIVIRPQTRAGCHSECFANEGDSGALIVDELNRAVGLLWGKSLQNTTEAFACHIHPVLHCLHVTPLRYNLML